MCRVSQLAITVAFGLTLIAGCASHTTRTETVTHSQNVPYPSDRTVERRTAAAKSTDEHSDGAVSNTVNSVADVVASPFRALGAAMRGLF